MYKRQAEDRSEFIASFDEYDLLIIDDLGVERSTEYAMAQMFFVIDSRYRSRRPMTVSYTHLQERSDRSGYRRTVPTDW